MHAATPLSILPHFTKTLSLRVGRISPQLQESFLNYSLQEFLPGPGISHFSGEYMSQNALRTFVSPGASQEDLNNGFTVGDAQIHVRSTE